MIRPHSAAASAGRLRIDGVCTGRMESVFAMSDSNATRRTVRRYKIFQPARGQKDDSPFALHLLDISTAGARAHSVSPPAQGDRISIDCGALLAVAKVRWVSAAHFGVQFVTPLSTEAVAKVAANPIKFSAKPTKV